MFYNIDPCSAGFVETKPIRFKWNQAKFIFVLLIDPEISATDGRNEERNDKNNFLFIQEGKKKKKASL